MMFQLERTVLFWLKLELNVIKYFCQKKEERTRKRKEKKREERIRKEKKG